MPAFKRCFWSVWVLINLFILPHTDPTGSWRQLVLQRFSDKKAASHPRPAILCKAHRAVRRPAVIMGLPYLLLEKRGNKGKDAPRKGQRKKIHSRRGSGPSPSPSSTLAPSPTPAPPPSAVNLTNSPTFVSRRKASTASVALSSPKSVRIRGARGCLHPQALPTSFHRA